MNGIARTALHCAVLLQYEEPKRELFPEVMNLKQMISNFSISKEVKQADKQAARQADTGFIGRQSARKLMVTSA